MGRTRVEKIACVMAGLTELCLVDIGEGQVYGIRTMGQ